MSVQKSIDKDISFFQSIKSLLKNWNVFSGTCSRKEFWYGQLFLFCSDLLIVALLFVFGYVFSLFAIPRLVYFIGIFLFINAKIFLGILNWTLFVRRYHGVGLSGHFFWFNISANGFLNDKFGIVFNCLGGALLIACYVVASFRNKKFKDYKPTMKCNK